MPRYRVIRYRGLHNESEVRNRHVGPQRKAKDDLKTPVGLLPGNKTTYHHRDEATQTTQAKTTTGVVAEKRRSPDSNQPSFLPTYIKIMASKTNAIFRSESVIRAG
jgi:hypothetical protein